MSRWVKGFGWWLAALAGAAALAAFAGARPSVGDCSGVATAPGTSSYRVRAADGNCLQGYLWSPAAAPAQAVAVLVHGIHDHPGRYDGLARALNAQGVAVLAQDHRGHGASGGARQRVDSVAQLAADVGLALAEASRRHPGLSLFLYGRHPGTRFPEATLRRLRPRQAGRLQLQAARLAARRAVPGAWRRRRRTWWTL